MADKNNEIKTKVVVDSSDAKKGMSDIGESSKDMSKGLNKAQSSMESLDEATGGLLTRFKAIVKNPIGLTLAALAGIFKLFQGAVSRSSKASSTFNKIGAKLSGMFNGLLAVLEPVVELIGDKFLQALNDPKQALLDLGNSIKENLINRVKSFLVFGKAFSALMSGEIKKASKLAADGFLQLTTGVEDATDKITKFGEEAKKTYNEAAKATYDLADAEKALARNRIALEKQQLKSLKLAEDERQIRDDITKDIEDRIEANRRLGAILDEQSQKEIEIAKQNLALAHAKQKADGETLESIEAIGDAEIKLLEIQERINGQRSEQLTNEKALLKEREDFIVKQREDKLKQEQEDKEAEEKKKEAEAEQLKIQQEAENEAFELEIEKRKERGERTLELELMLLEKKRQQDVSAADLTAQQIKNINDRAEFEKAKLRKVEEKANRAKEKKLLDDTISSAGEAFGIKQELALAEMIINAPQAIGNSFERASQAYAPPLSLAMGALGAAGVIAPIIKGIADIKSTRFSKKKGGTPGGGATPSVSSLGGGGGGGRNVTPELISDLSANNASRLGNNADLSNTATATASANIAGGSSGSVIFSEDSYSSFQRQVQFKEEKTTI